MRSFFIKTLGCKVNQVESAFIAEKLESLGLIPAGDEASAELLILNSCAVTEGAFRETKKILKNWAKLGEKRVILTGCAGQVFHTEFAKLAEDLGLKDFLILGNREKFELERFILSSDAPSIINVSSDFETCYPLLLKRFLNHSRAFVKIQDGCSSFCSYCIVPYARGKSRSLPEEHILRQIEIFVEQGYEEIVLTGIHIGMWGEDLGRGKKLVDLLVTVENFLSGLGKNFNLRLSSLEVNEIDEDFLAFAGESRFLCPHFHIPLQSGSNVILEKMNRRYRAEEYLEKINRLFKLFPQATFGADVIVGFPGEGDREFQETYELIERSPLNWLHVFPYSDRPGTPSEMLFPKVKAQQVRERVHLLRELHRKKREAFLKKQLGSVQKTVLEERSKEGFRGLTDNYIQVLIPATQPFQFKKGKISNFILSKIEFPFVIALPVKQE